MKTKPITLTTQVCNAYADCTMPFEEASQLRSLSFKAYEPRTPRQVKQIMKRAIPDGYNNFNADLLDLFNPRCEITIAREYSVCLYVRGKNLPSMNKLGADEYNIQPDGSTRIWWD
jgi:hypothetical protein